MINVKKYCFINGVEYRCRTCFDPGKTTYCLTDVASKTKTWSDFLKDLIQLQTNDDVLPNTVCNKCFEKLKSIYDFILEIECVNAKYSKLLESYNDPLHEGLLNDIDNLSNCFVINIPLDQGMPKIKLEEELSEPYNKGLEKADHLPDEFETKLENEDDPFSKTYDDFNLSSDKFKEEESANTASGENKTKPKRYKKTKPSEEKTKEDKGKEKKRSQTRSRLTRVTIQSNETEKRSSTDKLKNSFEDDDDDIIKVKPNVCPICLKEFKYKTYVDEHVKIVHEKLKPYKCSICEKTFASKNTFRIHKLSHTDNFPFQCEYCDRRFRMRYKLKIHTELHTTKPELLCPICKRSQKTEKDLEEHVKNHDHKRFQCNSCGKLFTRNSTLNDHYNAVHLKLRPYKCQYCELGFGDPKTRRMHQRKHYPKDRPIT